MTDPVTPFDFFRRPVAAGGGERREEAERLRESSERDRTAAEGVRRELEMAMRNAENARVLAEELRKIAERLREEAEDLRVENAEQARSMDEIYKVLEQQGTVLSEMNRAIESLRHERDEKWRSS